MQFAKEDLNYNVYKFNALNMQNSGFKDACSTRCLSEIFKQELNMDTKILNQVLGQVWFILKTYHVIIIVYLKVISF